MSNKIQGGALVSLSAAGAAIVAVLALIVWMSVWKGKSEAAEVIVYKTPTCGCCIKWVAHLRKSGFDVSVVNVPDTEPARKRFGVPRRLGSCHTATVGDYWVEGHVPADLVQRLLAEKPDDIRGIAVPGMPMGSPGMEGPNPVAYQVIAYGNDGKTTIYATRQGQETPD
ncbi:MAG: DUF411 domain-containing protein [Gammaproteobacteria bacterium]